MSLKKFLFMAIMLFPLMAFPEEPVPGPGGLVPAEDLAVILSSDDLLIDDPVINPTGEESVGDDVGVSAQIIPYYWVISFGDSLSDTGNLLRLEGFLPNQNQFNYWEGRATNGPVWVEYLARRLGAGLCNYAYGGAKTGYDLKICGLPKPVPGLLSQVTAFLNNNRTLYPGWLYTVFAGCNDLLNPTPGKRLWILAQEGARNVVAGATMLANRGARHIMIVTMPNIGLTPYKRLFGDPVAADEYVREFNRVLLLGIAALQASHPCADVFVYDLYGQIQKTAGQYQQYGFTNITDPCPFASAIIQPPVWDCPGYFFWDLIHCTTRVHSLMAKEMTPFVYAQYLRFVCQYWWECGIF